MKNIASKQNTPYRRDLGDGLVIKTASSKADVERVAAFDASVFNEEKVGALCRSLFTLHPSTQITDLIFVEDEKTNQVISSLCLIPWQWQYEDVRLKVGEMGIVATLETYRRRGLIRAQVEHFKELLAERNFDLSQIQGIGYFYRQFGYEYTLPLNRGYIVEMHQIPDPEEGETSRFTCRPETFGDLPALTYLYDEAAQDLDIHTRRDDAVWQYLFEHARPTCMAYEGWAVEDENGNVVGYFRIPGHSMFWDSLAVYEVSRLSYEAALAVLRFLKKLTIERRKPNIMLALPADCVLMQVARYLGAYDSGRYAWQIHIPNMAQFLKTIGPVLERRLAKSPFAGLTEQIRISLYQETITLNFVKGKLTQVELWEAVGCPIRIPPRAAVPLVLGYRNREELETFWPDLGMPTKYAYLIDILFPRMTSHIYTIY